VAPEKRRKPVNVQEHITYALDSIKASVDRRYKQVMCCGYPDIECDYPRDRRWDEQLVLSASWGGALGRDSLPVEQRLPAADQELMAQLEQAKVKVG
jgi:hypothetical protein